MSLIPKKIYQSWKTKELPENMKANVEKLRAMNPEYEYELYDDDDCKRFLLENFGENYANAFDSVLPGVFKCNIWKYAILYKQGGVYLDLDTIPLVPLGEIIGEKDRLVAVIDSDAPVSSIFQGFLACAPGHPVLLYALEMSILNIAMRRSDGCHPFSITGPMVMAVALNLYWNRKDTYDTLTPGRYDDGVLLYRNEKNHTYRDGEKVLSGTFRDYSSETPSRNFNLNKYYDTNPFTRDISPKKIVIMILLVVLVTNVILVITSKSF